MTSPPKLFLASVDGHRMSDPVQLPCDVEPVAPLDYICGKCKHNAWFIPVGKAPECVKCGMVSKTLRVREIRAKPNGG